MLVFGLVHDSGSEPPEHGWEPPEDEFHEQKRREWTGTWCGGGRCFGSCFGPC